MKNLIPIIKQSIDSIQNATDLIIDSLRSDLKDHRLYAVEYDKEKMNYNIDKTFEYCKTISIDKLSELESLLVIFFGRKDDNCGLVETVTEMFEYDQVKVQKLKKCYWEDADCLYAAVHETLYPLGAKGEMNFSEYVLSE